MTQEHRLDVWQFCAKCGMSAVQIVEEGEPDCVPPRPEVLAALRLEQIVNRAPLVAIAEKVMDAIAAAVVKEQGG